IAEKAAELKDDFIATVSHELRTPLTSIAASLELLADMDDAKRSEATSELIAIAKTNAERLVRLVNDILDVEKLEGGKVTFDMQRIDLTELLERAIEIHRPLAESCEVTLRLENPSRYVVLADPDRLTQVITNLLSNALKFSPPATDVTVGTEHCGD